MLDTFATPCRQDSLLARLQPRARALARPDAGLLLQVLDEVDYGILLVDTLGRILHANHLARHELAAGAVVRSDDAMLCTSTPGENETLMLALQRACLGHRVLLDLGQGSKLLSVAFVPLAHPLEAGREIALVMFGKREVCQTLTMSYFARSHGLTRAEEQVLGEICTGEKAEKIARKLGVGVATVRTQVSSIRRKTRTATVRQLIKRVALLPPLVPPLRLG